MPTYLVTDDLPYELDDDTRPLRFLRTVEPDAIGGQSVEDYFHARGLRVIRPVHGYWRKLPCPKHAARFELECPACNAKNSEWVDTNGEQP